MTRTSLTASRALLNAKILQDIVLFDLYFTAEDKSVIAGTRWTTTEQVRHGIARQWSLDELLSLPEAIEEEVEIWNYNHDEKGRVIRIVWGVNHRIEPEEYEAERWELNRTYEDFPDIQEAIDHIATLIAQRKDK